MAGFYSARSSIMPPLPWPTFAPPLSGNILNYGVSARLLPQDKCLDTGDDLFVVDEAIEELLPIFG